MEQTQIVSAVPTTEPAVSDTAAESTAEQTQGDLADAAAVLTVKFNKQEYQLSAEDAVTYAQMGMKYQSVQPLLERLKTAAAGQGKTLTALVDDLCGEPADVNDRLAREFCDLQRECPELTNFDALPEAVVQQAVENGTPLTLAYLRHCYGEHTRIRRARETASAAAAASAGTQKGAPQSVPDPAVEAMLRGVWQ